MLALSSLTSLQIFWALITGIILGLIYLLLLWRTLLYLPKIKNKGSFLFLSSVIRLFLLIFVAMYFSFENGARFILIFVGFFLTRLVVMKYVKRSIETVYKAKGKQKK